MANTWVINLDWQEANHLGMIQWRRDDLRTTKKHIQSGIEPFGFYFQVVTFAAQTARELLVRFWLTLCQVLSSRESKWQREDPNWTNALLTSFWQIVWAGRVWASRTTRTERAAFISNTSMDLLEPQHNTISAQSSRKGWWVKSLRISWYAMLLQMKLPRNKTCDYFYELTPGVVLPTSFPGFCPTRPPERDSRNESWERGCSPSCSHYWWVRRIINTQDRGYRNGIHLLRRSRWFVGLFPVERSSPVCTCCSTDTYTQGKISSSFMIRTMKAETKIWILSLRCAFAE